VIEAAPPNGATTSTCGDYANRLKLEKREEKPKKE